MTPREEAEPRCVCAHVRLHLEQQSAGREWFDETDISPGGWHDTFRDVWKCDQCGAEFVPKVALTACREECCKAVCQWCYQEPDPIWFKE